MPDDDRYADLEVSRCKCGVCDHANRQACIAADCNCCNLEDLFSLLTLHDFDSPHSMISSEDKCVV